MRRAGLAVGVAVGAVLATLMALVVTVASDDQGVPGLAGVVCAPPGAERGAPVRGFAGTQLAHAAAIVRAGVELGVPQRAQVIAVATAMQESRLLVYANAGVPASLAAPHDRVGSDRDSVGLFQQRAGWGPVATRMDPKASARLFYERLLTMPDWAALPLTVAAQRVQVSAFPEAYARWEQPASEVVGSVAGITCSGPGDPADLPANPQARRVIERASSQLGVRYVWGGGGPQGPTGGGFDCSGLMVFAFAGIGVRVPHQTQAIWAAFQPPILDPSDLQPGDMLLFSSSRQPGGIHHVGLYLGGGRMLHAPETGSTVKIVEDIWSSQYWTREFIGGVRPLPAPAPRS